MDYRTAIWPGQSQTCLILQDEQRDKLKIRRHLW